MTTTIAPRLRNIDNTAGARCLILDGKNAYNITSEFVTQTNAEDTARSMLGWNIIGGDIRKGVAGSPIELIGDMGGIRFEGGYAVSVRAADDRFRRRCSHSHQ